LAYTINVFGSSNAIIGSTGSDNVAIFGSNNLFYDRGGDDTVAVYGSGNNIVGGSGNDTITLYGSSNVVSSGGGNELINFVGGGDKLLDDDSHFADTVVGFVEGSDQIQLSGGDTAASAVASQQQVNSGQDTLITLSDGSTILLKGIAHVDQGFFS